jgi:hypothetical protein
MDGFSRRLESEADVCFSLTSTSSKKKHLKWRGHIFVMVDCLLCSHSLTHFIEETGISVWAGGYGAANASRSVVLSTAGCWWRQKCLLHFCPFGGTTVNGRGRPSACRRRSRQWHLQCQTQMAQQSWAFCSIQIVWGWADFNSAKINKGWKCTAGDYTQRKVKFYNQFNVLFQ